VGRITAVRGANAEVTLISAANSKLPVYLLDSGLSAILSGTNSQKLLLEFLPEGAKITPGELVVTAADGGLLPFGLPVGVVAVDGSVTPLKAPSNQGFSIIWHGAR
jgi:rod shape-determining protein MreC